MIFVTLGTQSPDFSRCLRMLEELIDKYNITDEVVAQIGHTKYTSTKIKLIDFVGEDEYRGLINKASIIITHAGSGALFNSINYKKKVIAVARLKKYSEMIDDHQLELVSKLSEMGYILDGTYSLESAWKKLETFNPKVDPLSCTITEGIENYIALHEKQIATK